MNNSGTMTAVTREAYEAKVGIESVCRVGNNPNLKGVVHEIMAKDAISFSPSNIANGTKGVLTKSVTAVRDDVLTVRAGKVIGRAQLKDTPASIAKTVKQVGEGKYQGTNLMGTVETVEAYNTAVNKLAERGITISQKMSSTGISSSDTARIAAKTIGKSAGELTAASVGKVFATSGAVGAAVSAGIEIFDSGSKFLKRDIEGDEFVGNVLKETTGGGLAAASGSAAATVVAAGTATVLAATAAPVWIPAAVGIGTAIAVGTAVKQIWDALWD
jgi:hypothetical protein